MGLIGLQGVAMTWRSPQPGPNVTIGSARSTVLSPSIAATPALQAVALVPPRPVPTIAPGPSLPDGFAPSPTGELQARSGGPTLTPGATPAFVPPLLLFFLVALAMRALSSALVVAPSAAFE